MKRNFIVILLCVIILVLTVVGILKDSLFKKQIIEIQTKSLVNEHLLAKRLLLHLNIATPIKFPDNIMVFDEKGKKFKLSEIIKNRNTIIFKFSKNHCTKCVETELSILNIPFQDIHKKNKFIILLTEGYTEKELMIIKQRFKIEYPLFAVEP